LILLLSRLVSGLLILILLCQSMIGRIGKSSEIDDKVEVLVEGSNWKWPSSHVCQDIIISTQSFKPNATLEDRVKWAASSNGKFCTKSAWESIRHRGSIKQWNALFCIEGLFPGML
jgi:hypothetical protein